MDMLSMSLLVTSKPMGRVLLFVLGSGSHVFSWVLPSGLSLCSGSFSSRSVIGDIYNTEFLMRRPCSQAGTLVRTTGIVTQLVFEHALRIRLKAETSLSPAATPTVTPEGLSEATTPDSGSVVDINIGSEGAGGGSQETPSEQSTSTAMGTNGKRKEEASRSDSGKGGGGEEGASSNLVGKMNNLVSTDLENLVEGRDILLVCLSSFLPLSALPSLLIFIFPIVFYFPLQVVMCAWFLYNILGWSAFIGMAVMVALFPIPGAVAGKIQQVQKETMRRVSSCLVNTLASGFTLRLDRCACAGCY